MSELLHDAIFGLALVRATKLAPGLAARVLLGKPKALVGAAEVIEWYQQAHPAMPVPNTSDWSACRDVLLKTLDARISVIPVTSPLYPQSLRMINDAPPVLYFRGNEDLLKQPPGVAVVGTRKASKNGLTIAERVAAYFVGYGWTVVSGLALGIDAAAHRGALHAKGATIAVLAHGLRSASPKTNANLAQEILQSGGAWASEYPIDVHARPEQFVHRNRIQVGFAAGSIIVEGELKSGSMTQAEFCLRNGRVLSAVVPDLGGRDLGLVDEGTSMLVAKRKALAIRNKDDYPALLEALAKKRDELQSIIEINRMSLD